MTYASIQRAFKVDVRGRIIPLQLQVVTRISEEPGTQVVALYNLRKAWLLKGTVVPASEK